MQINEPFIAVDFEIASNDFSTPCSIGVVKVENLRIVEEFYSLINPDTNDWSSINCRIHRIFPEMVKHSPKIPELWRIISFKFSFETIVAHQVSTDINILRKALLRYNISIPSLDSICTLEKSRIYFPELRSHGLENVCRLFDIELKNHHNALEDAKACAALEIAFRKGLHKKIKLEKIQKVNNSIKKKSVFDNYEKLSGEVLKPTFETDYPENPFFMKKVVFTGVLETISRLDAAELLKNLGADIDTTISQKTNFVILGHKPGPQKLKKIEKINSADKTINILSEKEFIGIINKYR